MGRVAITYLAVAWLILEIVGTTFPMLGFPDDAGRWVLVLLALGLPVALALAWAFDIGPEGIERTDPALPPRHVPARSRAWALVAIGAAVGAGLVWWISPEDGRAGVRSGGEVAVSEDVIAVLPFSVRGSAELEYLGEGIVDLVSAKLNGAGPIQAADPRLIIALVRANDDGAIDPMFDREVARAVGAGRYVTGELVEMAGKVRLTAQLHATTGPDDLADPALVEGTTEAIFDMLDGLVAGLLASSLRAGGERLQGLATVTTPSLSAAKAFLEGEQLMRRGLYREAAVAYDRAVAEDSTFALAHYRKSIAADWTDAYTARTEADRAYRFRAALPPRDQALVTGLRLRRHGRITDAEQSFRALLHQYPDDIEALIQLAELYFHDNPRRGRSIAEASEPFRRALELEPSNPIAQIHLARIHALNGSLVPLRESAEMLGRSAPDSERALEVMALHAYLSGDSVIQRRVREQLGSRPWYFAFHAAHGVGRFARDAYGAAELLEARPSDDPLLLSLVPNHRVVRGQYEAANAFLDRRRLERNATWDIFQAFLLTAGVVPVDRPRMASLADALERVEPADLRGTAWLEPYEDITDRFLEFQTDYYRALILIQLGQSDEARTLMHRLEAHDDFEAMGSVRQDALRSLRAEELFAAGDQPGALEILRSMELEIPHAASYQPMPDQTRARFLRARLEFEIGDHATSEAFLTGLDESWSPWDTYHRPLVYELLGRMAEEQGRTAEAVELYSRLLRLWQDCDPALVPRRDEVAARRDALYN